MAKHLFGAKRLFTKDFRIVAIIAGLLVLGSYAVSSHSFYVSFLNSRAAVPCDTYTSSSTCTGTKACEWYNNACHIPSCGGLLNVTGHNDPKKYEGGCFPNAAPSGQGWVYAGLTNDCGAVAGNSSRGCFYRPIGVPSSVNPITTITSSPHITLPPFRTAAPTPVVTGTPNSNAFDIKGSIGSDSAQKVVGTKISFYYDVTNMTSTILKTLNRRYGGVYVNFYLDNQFMGRAKVQEIFYYGYAGTPHYRAFISWTVQSGTHTIKGIADPDNKIPEPNESNNSASKTWTIK